jgi:hypothetical protein
MRHISHLSEVALCGKPREFKKSFDLIYWPGSRKARAALDRAVGWVHLEDWKDRNVTDPIPYFRSALAVISRNYSTAPGQEVVEKVLATAFQGNFSETLNTTGLPEIYKNLHRALQNILDDRDQRREDHFKAITPGFEDMAIIADLAPVNIAPVPQAGALPPALQGTRNALEEALGVAFIDYFNQYPVDDITEAFAGYGGTDTHINYALANTFGPSFHTTLDGLANAAPHARDVMNTLSHNFGTNLGRSMANNPGVPLGQEFDDLRVLIPRT